MAKQDKRKDRIDTSTDRQPLASNPFTALEGLRGALPSQEPPAGAPPGDAPAAGEGQSGGQPPAFRVQRTKKGGLPVFLEKRPNGKTVTVVRHISGDVECLLKLLKRQCGAGGVVRDDAIEVQGDHRERIETFLREHARIA
jgi:translation initiation factor 1 (eIF-1/SUI1)